MTDANDTGWRSRLIEAVETSPKSMRAVSLAAGRGPGYLHSVIRDGKDPSVDHLASVCSELGVSLPYILFGMDISPETEEIVRALQDNPSKRKAILALLQSESPAA